MTVTKFAAPHLAPIAGLLEAVRSDLMALGIGQYTLLIVSPDAARLRELGLAVEFSANALEALARALPRTERRPLLQRTDDLRIVKTNIMAAVRKLEVQ